MTTSWIDKAKADDLFQEDARRLGYLADDPHAPGMGRGLWAYFRDFGLLPPEDSGEPTGLELTLWGEE